MIMGAISIPETIYFLENIQRINKDLQDNERDYHFTKYNGDYAMKNRIIALFKTISPYLNLMRVNMFQYTDLKHKKDNIHGDIFDDMVYSKFPERVFYGLLRCKGTLMNINADIFMEDANEYKDFPKMFKTQLNTQALYRGEKFKINNCCQVPKYTEIGVELTDILLGIIRIILQFEKVQVKKTKSFTKKVELVNELLKIDNVYTFLANIKYFEWDNRQSTKEIRFKDYVDAYISSNY